MGFDKKNAFSKRLDPGRGIDRTRRVFEREPYLLGDMNSKCRMFKCGPDLMMGLALHEAGNIGRKMKYVTFSGPTTMRSERVLAPSCTLGENHAFTPSLNEDEWTKLRF